MITINIVCVGNLKEDFWRKASAEYEKRLSRFCKLNIIEIQEQNALELPEKILQKEGQEIIKHTSGESFLMALEGKEYSSEDFAKLIQSIQQTTSEITFVIGSSYGTSLQVKQAIKNKISLGKPTYPHNLARIMLLEQIYRAFMINAGSTYHK